MRIKTKFVQFEEEVQGIKFVLQEIDVQAVASMSLMIEKKENNKVSVNAIDVINAIISKCIVSWEGLEDEDGKILLCTDENKILLPINIKIELNNIMQNRMVLTGEEKKN